MKKFLIILGFVPLFQSCVSMQPSGGYGGTDSGNSGGNQYPTQTPTPQRSNTSIRINNVRLTNQYTILDMSFRNSDPTTRDPQTGRVSTVPIAISAESRLLASNGRSFRFIKSEGITIAPQMTQVSAQQEVNFSVYYERLNPGIEIFDLFECEDSNGTECWNSYNIRVSNPATSQNYPQQPNSTQTYPNNTPTYPNNTPSYPSNTPSIPAPSGSNGTPTKKPKSGKVGEVDNSTKPTETNTILVMGIVRDAKSKKAVSATINFVQTNNNKKVDSTQSFVSTGIYRSNLAANQSFVITAYARGYATFTETIDLSKLAVNGKLNKDIYLNPLAVGDKITLQNINFELSKSDLLPASYVELDKVVTMMQDFPQMEIRLEGHTDVVGDPDANQELSEERVESCKNYLVKKGIAPARIQTIGYGSSKPIIKSGTEEQRKVNRRVEMSVLKM